MLQAPRPAYPSDRASSEIFVGGGGRGVDVVGGEGWGRDGSGNGVGALI